MLKCQELLPGYLDYEVPDEFWKLNFPQLQVPLLWRAPNSCSVCLLSPQHGHLPRSSGSRTSPPLRSPGALASPVPLSQFPRGEDVLPPSHSGPVSPACSLLIFSPFTLYGLLLNLKTSQLPHTTALKSMPL